MKWKQLIQTLVLHPAATDSCSSSATVRNISRAGFLFPLFRASGAPLWSKGVMSAHSLIVLQHLISCVFFFKLWNKSYILNIIWCCDCIYLCIYFNLCTEQKRQFRGGIRRWIKGLIQTTWAEYLSFVNRSINVCLNLWLFVWFIPRWCTIIQ